MIDCALGILIACLSLESCFMRDAAVWCACCRTVVLWLAGSDVSAYQGSVKIVDSACGTSTHSGISCCSADW